MSKTVGILFSAGLDSTYLMWKNLVEGNTVIPFYINIENNEPKSLIEYQQAQILIELFNEQFSNGVNKISMCKVGNFEFLSRGDIFFVQPYLWSTLINFSIKSYIDEIQIGYVYGDDVISYIDDIKNLYEGSKPFMPYQPELTFPIIKTPKQDIVNELPKKYLKEVISCENPIHKYKFSIKNKVDDKYSGFFRDEKRSEHIVYEPCGECEVCQKIIQKNYYGCDVTRENYKNAEKKYNQLKLDEFNYKVIRDTGNNVEMGVKDELSYKKINYD